MRERERERERETKRERERERERMRARENFNIFTIIEMKTMYSYLPPAFPITIEHRCVITPQNKKEKKKE